jgi:putative peptidoglycan lipid II flippase
VLLALSLPAATLLAVAARPLVSIAFGFDAADSALVAAATQGFLLGLVGHVWLEILARAFFAQQSARPPLAARLANLLVFVTAGIVLYRPMGAAGIAVANSLGFTLEAGILFVLLARTAPEIRRAWSTLPRAVAGSMVGAGLAYAGVVWLPIGELLSTAIGLSVGGVVALIFVWPEIRELRSL